MAQNYISLDFLPEPIMTWSIQPTQPQSSQPQSKSQSLQMNLGNGIIISPDGLYLYITYSTGLLHVINVETGNIQNIFDPIGYEYGYCRCKVQYNIETNSIFYVVGDISTESSTIFKASHPFLQDDPYETMDGIQGFAERDLAVGTSGSLIYVTSNYEGKGRFYVFETNTRNIIYQFLSEDMDLFLPDSIDESEWGPVGISRIPIKEDFSQVPHINEQNDFILFGRKQQIQEEEEEENGRVVVSSSSMINDTIDMLGYTYSFTVPIDDLIPLQLEPLNDVSWRTLTAPIMSKRGEMTFFAVSRSEYRGWIRKRLGASSSWSTRRLTKAFGDIRAPFSSPVLSFNETMLFVSVPYSDIGTIHAIGAEDGKEIWEARGTEISNTPAATAATTNESASVLAGIVVPPANDDRIYFCDSAAVGGCHAVDSKTGDVMFTIPTSRVVGDFTISPDGTTLFIASNGISNLTDDTEDNNNTADNNNTTAAVDNNNSTANITEAPTPSPSQNEAMAEEVEERGEVGFHIRSYTVARIRTLSPSTPHTTSPIPSNVPSSIPSLPPSNEPFAIPSSMPTISHAPSHLPSTSPSISPSVRPSTSPSMINPTQVPSMGPTFMPSGNPSVQPTIEPKEAIVSTTTTTMMPTTKTTMMPMMTTMMPMTTIMPTRTSPGDSIQDEATSSSFHTFSSHSIWIMTMVLALGFGMVIG